jgi:hypothetical protein
MQSMRRSYCARSSRGTPSLELQLWSTLIATLVAWMLHMWAGKRASHRRCGAGRVQPTKTCALEIWRWQRHGSPRGGASHRCCRSAGAGMRWTWQACLRAQRSQCPRQSEQRTTARQLKPPWQPPLLLRPQQSPACSSPPASRSVRPAGMHLNERRVLSTPQKRKPGASYCSSGALEPKLASLRSAMRRRQHGLQRCIL